jgi:NAD(P)-dependent dehydrogenase (short-subunit alcohol dehydrogenase family)
VTVVLDRFRLDGRVVVITGGAGVLGIRHAEAIAESGGVPVLWDIDTERTEGAVRSIQTGYGRCGHHVTDVTDPASVEQALGGVLSELGRVDALVNNAAFDPKVTDQQNPSWARLEHFPLALWNRDLAVGLTGAFLCSQAVGRHMAAHGGGVILNIASDLSLISPDQRLYRRHLLAEAAQPVKPVTYSVAKHGLIGLTRYLATYWADAGIRVNAISPGGVYRGQPDEFVERLTSLIPLGRMAAEDEYKAAIVFLLSDASSYMTGANLVMDGGRTCW